MDEFEGVYDESDLTGVYRKKMMDSKLEALTAKFYDCVPADKRLELRRAFAECNDSDFTYLYAQKMKSKYVALFLTLFIGCGAQWLYLCKFKSFAIYFGLVAGAVLFTVIALLCGSFTVASLPITLAICCVAAIGIWSVLELFLCFRNVLMCNYDRLIRIAKMCKCK